MKIAIIDYGAGNLFSVAGACKKLGYDTVLTDDADTIAGSDRVIFPGVGNAVSAARSLAARGLDKVIPTLRQPVLGICLGMQMMMEASDEGNTRGIGIFQGRVKNFRERDGISKGAREEKMSGISEGYQGKTKNGVGNLYAVTIKVPHMGWNIIDKLQGPLFEGIDEDTAMYFVHSYYVPVNEYTVATGYYGGSFTAAMARDNFFGCQFHPEKSGEKGLRILKNFLTLEL